MDAETVAAVRVLRLKLKAAKGLIRDLTIAAAECERLLDQTPQSPKEAERHANPQRTAA